MKRPLPILVIVPHGGYSVPEELSGYETVEPFDLFMEADSCANEVFAFDGLVDRLVRTDISRLFIDLDRPSSPAGLRSSDAVMKKETSRGRPVFREGIIPDELAVANLIRRYYIPLHREIRERLKGRGIRLILDCHTMMPVGPKKAPDAGLPRPLVTITSVTGTGTDVTRTCTDELARGLLDQMQKHLEGTGTTVAEPFALNEPAFDGYMLDRYGRDRTPMMRLSVSRSLFLTDRWFNIRQLKVDEARIAEVRERLWTAISRFYTRYFK